MPKDRDDFTGQNLTPVALAAGLLGRVAPPHSEAVEAKWLYTAAARLPDEVDIEHALSDALCHPESAALRRLTQSLKLNLAETLMIAVLQAVETQAIAGRAVAWLQAPMGGSRPTLGLLAGVLPGATVPDLATGGAVTSGLVSLSGSGPLPECQAALLPEFLNAFAGSPLRWPGAEILLDPPSKDWPKSLQTALNPVVDGLKGQKNTGLVMRSISALDLREISIRLANALAKTPCLLDLEKVTTVGLGAFLTAGNLLPVFCAKTAPGQQAKAPSLPGYSGPIIASIGPEGHFGREGEPSVEWALPLPLPQERAALWSKAFRNTDLTTELGQEHLQSAGRIKSICQTAASEAALNPNMDERTILRAALWASDSGGLGSLAQPITDVIPEDTLVTSDSLRRDLDYLLARCQAREKLTEGLGGALTARYKLGVRSLFTGPSGTGKTLAASWLSGRLNLPLYRVDLAAVSSKYIGETEKNLSELLAKAEEQEVVLLFDEADSLFGKRTDISDSNDRFANAQTNYLLQRIETFSGIVLLTSNAKNRFDEAFTRRIDTIVDFNQPVAEERFALWAVHLGEQHSVSVEELNRLSAYAEITGGHIRNVVLMAAVLAKSENRSVAYPDLLEGLKAEYRKLGETVPGELTLLRGVA